MSQNKLELIKELRQRTNSALGDVKKALEATDYNIEAAIKWLKENGIVKAAKKIRKISVWRCCISAWNSNTIIITWS